jgi:hypothetical protein
MRIGGRKPRLATEQNSRINGTGEKRNIRLRSLRGEKTPRQRATSLV